MKRYGKASILNRPGKPGAVQAVGVDARLKADPRPNAMQTAVPPEVAVLEDD